MFSSFNLNGTCRYELNTEMRFLFASAKVDGCEIVKIVFPECENEKENERIRGCIIKVLRTLKKEKIIQFYVNKEGFAQNSTEASFLTNKYNEYLDQSSDQESIYVKI